MIERGYPISTRIMKEKADTAQISTNAGGENEKYSGFSDSFILSLLSLPTLKVIGNCGAREQKGKWV